LECRYQYKKISRDLFPVPAVNNFFAENNTLIVGDRGVKKPTSSTLE
jgi:hypothetical protein